MMRGCRRASSANARRHPRGVGCCQRTVPPGGLHLGVYGGFTPVARGLRRGATTRPAGSNSGKSGAVLLRIDGTMLRLD